MPLSPERNKAEMETPLSSHADRSDGTHLRTADDAGNFGHDEALARARRLAAVIREGAEEADRTRRVCDASIAALKQAGLFRLMAPRAFGGAQLGVATLVETVAEVAAACASTGWVYGVLTGHSWMASLLPAQGQQDVFADPDTLIASVVRFGGECPRRVPGGFHIRNGAGKFCSGIDHADWILLGVTVEEDGAAPAPYYLLVPRAVATVEDDWFTMGLRGTGSRSLRIADAFVPDHRAVAIADIAKGTAPGAMLHDAPLYRAPFPEFLPFPLAGVPLGIARAAIASFAESAKVQAAAAVGDAAAGGFLLRLSNACAEVDAATALVLRNAAEIDSRSDGGQTPALDRARYVRDIAHAANRCRDAVNSLFEASGGSAIYDSFPLQRLWRDINAAAAHNSFLRDRTAMPAGRAMLGLPDSGRDRIGH